MVRSFLVARPRAAILVLFALLLAAIAVAIPHPAAATGGACGGASWFDNPGTVYSNGDYRANAASNFYDSYQGRYTHLNGDLQSWRYTGTGSDGFISGHCYRQLRFSVWVDDGSYGLLWIHQRTWANSGGLCGQLVSDYWTGGTWGGGQEHYSGWWDYSGCGGPQGDGWGFGKNADWTPYYPSSVPSPYVNF
jgi:hypothetical protein